MSKITIQLEYQIEDTLTTIKIELLAYLFLSRSIISLLEICTTIVVNKEWKSLILSEI